MNEINTPVSADGNMILDVNGDDFLVVCGSDEETVAIVRALNEHDKAVAMLREGIDNYGFCVGCGQWAEPNPQDENYSLPISHAPDCALAALLPKKDKEATDG